MLQTKYGQKKAEEGQKSVKNPEYKVGDVTMVCHIPCARILLLAPALSFSDRKTAYSPKSHVEKKPFKNVNNTFKLSCLSLIN